ncbi:hypothetical protein ABIE61_000344 [Marinobacterium sp. MBR-111]|jgi:hypothetical protein|uniref:hypothetical protein n=1 Tax=Marinobacterium sp. MBR-111 TaxID=3156463 RepID=UPI0033933CE0
MHREQIKELALTNGFKLKQQSDGSEDLTPYVYGFAKALAAKAVMDFAATPVGAYEAGFVDTPHLTIAQLYQVARHHVRDNYGVETKSLAEEMGEDFARECAGGAGDE